MHEAGAVNDDNRTTSSQSVTGQRYSQHPQFTLPTLKETEMYEPKSNSNSQNGHDSNLQQQILGSRSPRVIHWFTFFLISIIVLGSSMEAKETAHDWRNDVGHKQRWAVACSTYTFLITCAVVYMHTSTRLSVFIVGTKLEGFVILTLLTFWIAIVAVVSDAENGLAVNEEGVVIYGNLYYFSWGGLVTAVMLFVSFLRSIYFIDVVGEFRDRAPRLMIWAAFLTSSIIVMGSGASIFDINCDVISPEKRFCSRTKLAVALGIIGTISGIVMVGMKVAIAHAPFWAEFSAGMVLFLLYAFGVAYITSEKGPGAPLGNLYYAMWASFIETFFICVGCFETYQELLANQIDTQATHEDRVRNDYMYDEQEKLNKEYDEEDDRLFGNYDEDDEEDDQYDEDDGRSFRSGYDDARSVRSGYDDARSVRSGYDDARSVRSGYDDARSVRSGYDDARSVRSGVDDAKSVRSSFTNGDARSLRSGGSFYSTSRSIPLADNDDFDEDIDARSYRSRRSNLNDGRSVRSVRSTFTEMTGSRSVPLDVLKDDNSLQSFDNSSQQSGYSEQRSTRVDNRIPMTNSNSDSRSVRSGVSHFSRSRSIPLDDDDDDDLLWSQTKKGNESSV